MRVAIVFDDKTRPETTGGYCRRALDGLADVHHFHPDDAARIPRQGVDLYLQIDDGLSFHLPPELRPAACWVIDTHLNFGWCLQRARGCDFVFAAQRDGAERLRQAGIASASWLPLTCDPTIHRKHDVARSVDVCFVGNVMGGLREELLRLLRSNFRNTFVGQAYFEDMARAYSAARVVFNRSVRNDVNMRVFEAVACGSLLLTNDLAENGQAELFRDGVHLATYRSAEELLDKVRFYLVREEVRERIAAAGRAEALAHHTYRHRMETLLASAAPDTALSRPPGSEDSTRGFIQATPKGFQTTTTLSTPLGPPGSGANTAPGGALGTRGTGQAGRVPDYFQHARPELLALIPETARTVLDIGCGAGLLGAALRARQPAEVVGIERDEAAAHAARQRLDRVIVGDVETLQEKLPEGAFDVVVCGDVLEHLYQPGKLLERISEWLAPGGCVVASIPNVRHHSVISSLLAGNWTYEAAGLLDHTHLRFFTRRGIERMFRQAAFNIRRVAAVPGPGYEEWQAQGRPAAVRLGRLNLSGLPPEEVEEFFIYQFLVTAEPVPPLLPRRTAWGRPATTDTVPPVPTHVVDAPTVRRGPMRFTQDFLRDFDQFDFFGTPFAFVRYGDGERAICMGQPIGASDGWFYDGRPCRLAADLNAALRFNAPDYYLGISDGCCDRPARDWYLSQVCVPLEQVTFANIFVNGNYHRFRALDLRGSVLVASQGGDFTVPADVFANPPDIDALVNQLLAVDRPILVAAGPASPVIIHRYWQRSMRKQTIVDVGSALDERTKGRKTRQYQQPGTRTANLICRW